ncbi:FAD-dependent oxidoreductase [Phyllobacterium zundukense]|uniref:FAD-dependent oxidoreductase n=1 Tax=Phyllobacterium zundukense TaxID=1867719 RepID=A0ACD4CVZ0_9HYPH|nr:FAD-dependent oxidoreductase [Phyllobacterium zundukense]UXN57744.1 FAD-dependent oxidoreductase [Phyllobacterium zundukense]
MSEELTARAGCGSTENMKWDQEADVVVFGSGAAGLSAALFAAKQGLKVLVFEKSPKLGGTTALSNGMIWIPCSPQAVAAKVSDSLDNARTYLKNELGNYYRADYVDALLQDGPKAVSELEKDTDVKFTLASAPDYHSSQVGGVDSGRALSPAPYDGRLLKADFKLIGDPIRVVLGGMMISSSEVGKFLNPLQSGSAMKHVLKRVSRYVADRTKFPRGTELSGGNALIARLLTSLRKRGVPISTNASLADVVRSSDGNVIGATVRESGGIVAVRARRGVVLATGGFARSPQLRQELSGNHQHDYTLAHPDATGDGISAARRAGADVDTEGASAGFWTPISLLNSGRGEVKTVPYGWLDRGRPGVIAVGPNAKRFVNESNSYHDICLALFENGYSREKRFYFICDAMFIKKRGMGQLLPWPWTSSTKKFEKLGYLQSGKSLSELAAKIGLDASTLEATVSEHNRHAETGVDPYFKRGESAFNRMLGDPAVGIKNPNLGKISHGPFYALQIVPATLGTSTGLAANTYGQVLDGEGMPIKGLYACGNDMTSPMRGIYPGAGITIGPGITFAFRVVEHIKQTVG